MINLPYNLPLVSQSMPSQSVPVQTSNNNFSPFQQPQMVTQQMQTSPYAAYPTNPQDPFKQPFYQVHQADMFVASHQYRPNVQPSRNPWPPNPNHPQMYQTYSNIPLNVQTQPNYGSLPQNVLDQIRSCVSSAAPIFILPGGCHQSTSHQQTGAANQGGIAQHAGQSAGVNTPASIYCSPSFYPCPIPMPMFDPFGAQTRGKDSSRGCSCCQKRQDGFDDRNYPLRCCCNIQEQEEHRCTATNDDTICSKRNCPASVSLQALASQLLSLSGIISCAATRLILRKVPGSNITSTMDDTMDKALKCINALTKDQLLAESRNAQEVNALINFHMTTYPPANIIPLLTLLQLKVNVLKAQVESMINKKVMECQGYGFEVESNSPIDPTVLTMKTNAELRQLLSALRQKECDERVNANFSPYHSQKVIAEARLNNVQAKIGQVEAEFQRRRGVSVPTPTLPSRIIQQFAESRCTFGFAQTKLFEPYVQRSTLESPDPFVHGITNPKKLYLKPHEPEQGAVERKEGKKVITSENGTSPCQDTGTGECTINPSAEKAVEPKSSIDSCSCEESSSNESIDEGKKKLRLRIDQSGKVTITTVNSLRDVSLLKLAPNVVAKIRKVSVKDRGEKEEEDEEEKEDPEEVKRVCVREREAKEEAEGEMDEELKSDDSEVQLVDVTKVSTDSKEVETITITDDEDEDARSETIDNGKSSIKKEPESDTDSGKKIAIRVDPPSMEDVRTFGDVDAPVKKEPTSVEKKETFDYTDTGIKKEPEEDDKVDKKPSYYTTTMSIQVKPKTETTYLHVIPKQRTKKAEEVKTSDEPEVKIKAEPLVDATSVKKETKTNDDTPKQSKMMFKLKQIKSKSNKDPKTRETDESSSAQSPLEVTEAKFDGKALREKPIAEDVSKDQETRSETVPNGETPQGPSSDLYKSTFKITLKPTKKKTVKKQEIIPDWTWSKNETNPESGGSQPRNKKGRNVQIISMMTHVTYDRHFGDFWGSNINERIDGKTKDRCKRNLKDDSSKDVKRVNGINESGTYFLSEKINPVISADQQYEPVLTVPISTDTDSEVKKKTFLEKMFPKNRQMNDEKMANGLRHFPPLKHADPKATGITTTGTSENIFHQKEIGSGFWKTVCDRSSSYHRDSKMENSIVSAIYSMIENPIVSLGSLLNNIPNLQDVVSNFPCKKLSFNICDKDTSLLNEANEQRVNDAINKKIITENDWILLPSSTSAGDGDEHRTSNENHFPVSEECSYVRKMKHSIIVDKEKKNYVLIGGSISGQSRELSRNGFKRPYQARRSLVIRSRLKNHENSKHEHLRPFTIVKRFKRNKVFVSQTAKRADHKLKANERVLSLHEIPEETKTLNDDKSSNGFVKLFENKTLERNSKHDNGTIDNCISVSNDRLSTESVEISNN